MTRRKNKLVTLKKSLTRSMNIKKAKKLYLSLKTSAKFIAMDSKQSIASMLRCIKEISLHFLGTMELAKHRQLK